MKYPYTLIGGLLGALVMALPGVPARVVHGIALKEQKERLPVVHWLEIYNKKWWQAIDPITGDPGLPDNFLSWWRGPLSMAKLTGGSDYPFGSPAAELDKIFSLNLPEAQTRAILGDNFRRLCRLG